MFYPLKIKPTVSRGIYCFAVTICEDDVRRGQKRGGFAEGYNCKNTAE